MLNIGWKNNCMKNSNLKHSKLLHLFRIQNHYITKRNTILNIMLALFYVDSINALEPFCNSNHKYRSCINETKLNKLSF